MTTSTPLYKPRAAGFPPPAAGWPQTRVHCCLAALLLVITAALALYAWITSPAAAGENTWTRPIPAGVRRAVMRMGPYYQYRLSPDGVLQVDTGDGRGWRRLHYEH